jgi:hypothetical protein
LTSAFLEYHRGFLLKELMVQAESTEHFLGMRNTGVFLWNGADSRYREFWDEDLEAMVMKPHVSGLTNDIAATKPGSWGGSLFLYQPPRFGFSRSEQRLLLAGLSGGTDEEIGDRLGVSLAAVRKAWKVIYERVGMIAPDLVFNPMPGDGGTRERGKEKKQRLLAYIREHPEELRPVSRKLLQGVRAARVPSANRTS